MCIFSFSNKITSGLKFFQIFTPGKDLEWRGSGKECVSCAVLLPCARLFVAQPCSQSLPLFHPTNDQQDEMLVLGHPRELVLSNVLVGQMYVFSGVWLTNLPHASSKVFSFVFEST
jgi:hypothetical protein